MGSFVNVDICFMIPSVTEEKSGIAFGLAKKQIFEFYT